MACIIYYIATYIVLYEGGIQVRTWQDFPCCQDTNAEGYVAGVTLHAVGGLKQPQLQLSGVPAAGILHSRHPSWTLCTMMDAGTLVVVFTVNSMCLTRPA